jgi:hypothetical protein
MNWLERLNVFDFEVSLAVAGYEVVLEVDLRNEALLVAEFRAKSLAALGKVFRSFIESLCCSQIATHGD